MKADDVRPGMAVRTTGCFITDKGYLPEGAIVHLVGGPFQPNDGPTKTWRCLAAVSEPDHSMALHRIPLALVEPA